MFMANLENIFYDIVSKHIYIHLKYFRFLNTLAKLWHYTYISWEEHLDDYG